MLASGGGGFPVAAASRSVKVPARRPSLFVFFVFFVATEAFAAVLYVTFLRRFHEVLCGWCETVCMVGGCFRRSALWGDSEIVPKGSISLYRCHAAAVKLFQVFPGGVEVLIYWSEGRYLVSKFLVFSRGFKGFQPRGYLAGLVRNLLIYVCSPQLAHVSFRGMSGPGRCNLLRPAPSFRWREVPYALDKGWGKFTWSGVSARVGTNRSA